LLVGDQQQQLDKQGVFEEVVAESVNFYNGTSFQTDLIN
jgi:hypothetical protein